MSRPMGPLQGRITITCKVIYNLHREAEQQAIHTREGNESIALDSGHLYRQVQYSTEVHNLSQTIAREVKSPDQLIYHTID